MMRCFLCSECNDVNCALLNPPSIFDMPMVPDRCMEFRKKNPIWQEYVKTAELFRACKNGSKLSVFGAEQ